MKSGEFTGHSIDEAVFHGLQELGLSIDEVSIETLQTETKGLFGIGAKLARVRLVERAPEEVETVLRTQQEVRPREGLREERHPREERRPREDRRPREGMREGTREDRECREERGPREDRQRKPREDRYEVRPAIPYSAELAKEHEAGRFLSGLLERMDIKANVLACETEDGVQLRIDSDARGLLIGRRGETLDAMQYLTSLHINRNRKQEKYLRVSIDTEDYRSKREDTLVKLARRQAARVKASGRPVSMEPMNPYERRVLHASLQNNPFVTTHSEGEEPNRRVVITPRR